MLVYDETVEVSYPLFVCPDCGAKFYGGGRTMHNDGCSHLPNTMDYSGLETHFGPKQVTAIKEMAVKHGEDFNWYGITLAMLKQQFPHLL